MKRYSGMYFRTKERTERRRYGKNLPSVSVVCLSVKRDHSPVVLVRNGSCEILLSLEDVTVIHKQGRTVEILQRLDLLNVEVRLADHRCIGSRTRSIRQSDLICVSSPVSRGFPRFPIPPSAHPSRKSANVEMTDSPVVSFTLGILSGSSMPLLVLRRRAAAPSMSASSASSSMPPWVPARPRTLSNARGSTMGRDCGSEDELGVPPGADDGGKMEAAGDDIALLYKQGMKYSN